MSFVIVTHLQQNNAQPVSCYLVFEIILSKICFFVLQPILILPLCYRCELITASRWTWNKRNGPVSHFSKTNVISLHASPAFHWTTDSYATNETFTCCTGRNVHESQKKRNWKGKERKKNRTKWITDQIILFTERKLSVLSETVSLYGAHRA